MTNTGAVSGRRPTRRFTSFLSLVAVAALAATNGYSAGTGKLEKPVTQTFAPPQVGASEQQVAQVIRKRPDTAHSDAGGKSSRKSTASAATTTTTRNMDAALTSLSTSSLTSLISQTSSPALGISEIHSTPLFGGVTSDTESLQRLILSTPPVGFESTTMPLVSAPLDLGTTGPINLDVTMADVESAEVALPDTPLPQAQLDRLSSSSKEARRITLMSAVCQALSSNQNLRVEKLRPEISNTAIESAYSEFDTNLDAGVFYRVNKTSRQGPQSRDSGSSFSSSSDGGRNVTRTLSGNVGISGRLPTGTNYSLGFDASRTETNSTRPFFSSSLNANITQNLLRGAGCDVNLIRVWTAKNDFVGSLYILQQALINLVNDTENAYWDLFLTYKTLDIQLTAYEVAKQLRLRAEEFVRVGRAAPLEALSAQAEEASRISEVITAASNLELAQLALLRLINPECLEAGWRTLVYPIEPPVLPLEPLKPEQHVRVARYYRPDLRQAQLDLANGELEVVRTENGLLPQLDLVAGYGLAGNGNSFGNTIEHIGDRDFPSYNVGLQFSYPLQNRAANAAYRRANFQRRLAEEAIRNFCQIIDVDVRTAILVIERTTRLIDSTRVTEALRVRELEAESEKFRVGRSTQINVNQAQRDLVQARLDTVRAEVANIKAYLALYKAEGTALLRRGIEPIKITPESGVP